MQESREAIKGHCARIFRAVGAEMKPKIGLITGLWSEKNRSAFGTTLKLINVIEPLSTEITWVATNCIGDENELPKKVNLIRFDIRDIGEKSFLKMFFYHLLHQIKIILKLRKLREVDVFIFAFGGHWLLFPFLFTTLFLKKKTVLRIEGRPSAMLNVKFTKVNNRIVKMIIFSIMERAMYFLAHRLVLEFEQMTEHYNLQKYQYKIDIGGLYVVTSFFKESKKLIERTYQIGYIGRFSIVKGILEFTQSLPLILKGKEVKAIMVGEGDLEDEIKEILINNNIRNEVKLVGWIENRELSRYLNDIQIVIVPSYMEGLPNIVLEAMACGCIVLATSVGGIPQVIKDGETGFILGDNSPECIAENVMRALKYPHLDKIVSNARELVQKEFAYEVTVERYRKILEKI